MANQLANESSPYLRQHCQNPVDWFSWDTQAFELASQRNVPILLSIGYSACHWCHVMAHECFEDLEVATMMNRLFVNIKVDREERPDVDSIYMDAVQAMTGRGGWPLTVFLTPNGEPFFGGTYFPKRNFLQLMKAVDVAWNTRRDDIDSQCSSILARLGHSAELGPDDSVPNFEIIDRAVQQLNDSFDPQWGGFGVAPKFPHTTNIELLMQRYLTEQTAAIKQTVTVTLDSMASGGMYDHLGGGFSRYSVDHKWLIPHFEKMLYDQAQMIRTYTHAAVLFNQPHWKQIVEETIEYVLRDLTHPLGGFFSAQDADSVDDNGVSHEGHYYLFTTQQVKEILPPNLVDLAFEWYEITSTGNFESTDKCVPTRLNNRGKFERDSRIDDIRNLLFSARRKRNPPLLDDKVLTEWNAMMTVALIEAATLFNRTDWLDAAIKNGEFLYQNMRHTVCSEQGAMSVKWSRSWQESAIPQTRHNALAIDLAHLVDAFTRLAEATGLAIWITRATQAADYLLDNFWDETNFGLFTVATTSDQLIVKQKDLIDGATPPANAVAAIAMQRLSAILGQSKYSDAATKILRLYKQIAESNPSAVSALGSAITQHHQGISEIVITGDRLDLVRYIQSRWIPTAALVWGERYDSPLWRERSDGAAYVCKNNVCLRPVTSIIDLQAVLSPRN